MTLPKIQIEMKSRHIKKLQNNVWNENPVPAKLSVNGQNFDVGLTYRGDHVRLFPKKSYRISFPAFNEVFKGSEVHLNAEFRDPSFFRNKLSFDFFHLIGGLAPESKHVLVDINGKSKGIYLQLESVDRYFLQKRYLPDGPIFYATTNQATFSLLTAENEPKKSILAGYEMKEGSDDDFQDLENLLIKINTLPRDKFANEIIQYVDVKKYLIWLCGIVCTQNFDGFIHNYALYKNGQTGLYEIIPWDYDATWGRDWDGKLMEYDYVPIEGYNTLTARLLDVKEFRNLYRDILEEVLNTTFTTNMLEPHITTLYNQIEPYITLDPYKNRKSIEMFQREPDLILQFIKDRNQFLREQLIKLS